MTKTNQLDLFDAVFDRALGAQLRDRAIASIHANAEDFVSEVVSVIRGLRSGLLFTTDDLWGALEGVPHDARAMGAAIRVARSSGLIEPTDRFRPSLRPVCHRRPVRVWERL